MPDPLMYIAHFITFVGIFAILSLSLSLEYGNTGLINFGKVAFFMIEAYTSALLARMGAPYIACAIMAMTSAGALGLLISLPALRLREDYLAIAVFSFGEIMRLIFKNEGWLEGFGALRYLQPSP